MSSPAPSAKAVDAMAIAADTRTDVAFIAIRLDARLVVDGERRVLFFLSQEAVADRERVDLRAHEAAEGILGRADDRLPAHVETGVDQHRAAGRALERGQQRMEARIGLAVDGLDASRPVDVRHRR